MITFERIYTAYENCVAKKTKSTSALQFSYADLTENIQDIVDDINNRTYVHGRSSCFVNLDPCPREIFAAQFRDRVIQHFFVEELEPVFDRILIPNTTSCRKGRGTDYALKELRKDLIRLTDKGKEDCFYYKIDISGYFMSIQRERITKLMTDLIEKEYTGPYKAELLYIAPIIYMNNPVIGRVLRGDMTLFAFVPERKRMNPKGTTGLAIGNITAQVGSNLYLNDLDHFCVDTLKVDGYIRYVDDIIVLVKDKSKLLEYIPLIKQKIEEAGLKVSEKKCRLDTVYHGVKFLGKVSFPYGYQRQASHSAGRLMRAAREMIVDENLLSRLNSQVGRLKHYSCYGITQDFLKELPDEVWEYVNYDEQKQKFVLKEKCKNEGINS